MLPDWNLPFKVVTDACQYGIGAVLLQTDGNGTERPIAFYSKYLSETDMKWSTRDRELYAFVVALDKWKYFLLGRSFLWQSDHEPLANPEPEPSDRVSRWYEKLSRYDYRFKYV